MIIKFEEPYLVKGEIAKDSRGQLIFVNDFNLNKTKRFYIVNNKKLVRAWHGHKNEAKYVFAISGKALVGAVKIDNWKHPSKDCRVYKFTLSFDNPAILYIPRGYANGFKSLTANTKLMFFSTTTVEKSKKDSYRFEAKYWNIWG